MPFCLIRIARILAASEAAPQPLRPEVSIFQSFSVFAVAFGSGALV
jgi:hypothetical protein